ncbi:MAG: 2-aminoethylphosphonate--pyruvate transaminase [Proteobacteria bacterium]|nr:2-aminoethylphosphonate--pyruvate transaminase [Pseudomonadota bacterium]
MKLLIPGPVTTHRSVRAALAHDFAPWDTDFVRLYHRLGDRLLRLGGGAVGTHVALTLPGCGHFVTEAAIRSLLPPGAGLLVPMTGPYAERMARLAREAGRSVVPLVVGAEAAVDPAAVRRALQADPGLSHVGLIYSETGTGVVHDPAAVGAVVRGLGRRMIVDAVSAFGALPIDLGQQPEIDAVVFTPNKCLEGVPGAGFVLARADRLAAGAGQAGSWSFDLADVAARLAARDGPRFTPAAQVLNALGVALDRLEAEGGPAARLARYQANMQVLAEGMRELGLAPVLPAGVQGPIVLNVHAPGDPRWDLQAFVDAVKRRGFVISNFYNTARPSFRLGCIGALRPVDMRRAVAAIGAALEELGVRERRAA